MTCAGAARLSAFLRLADCASLGQRGGSPYDGIRGGLNAPQRGSVPLLLNDRHYRHFFPKRWVSSSFFSWSPQVATPPLCPTNQEVRFHPHFGSDFGELPCSGGVRQRVPVRPGSLHFPGGSLCASWTEERFALRCDS